MTEITNDTTILATAEVAQQIANRTNFRLIIRWFAVWSTKRITRFERLLENDCFDSLRTLDSRIWKTFTNVDINYSNKRYTKIDLSITDIAVTNTHDNYSFASISSATKLLASSDVWRILIINTSAYSITLRTYYNYYSRRALRYLAEIRYQDYFRSKVDNSSLLSYLYSELLL